MDLKQAYEVLGLPEGTPLSEVNKRYDLLLLKAHNKMKREPSQEIEQELTRINEAYNRIKEHHTDAEIASFEQQKYGKFKSKGKMVQKIDHFWEYYRLHVLGGIIGIVVLVMIVQAVINHRQQANLPPPDLEIMLFGNFPIAETTDLENELLEAFPEWERVGITVSSVDFSSPNGPDYAMLQRAIVLLATERPHLYVVDEGSFSWLLPQQVFEPLEALAEYQKQPDSDIWIVDNMRPDSDVGTDDLDPALLEDRVYGVDTTGSELWDNLYSPNSRKIVTFSSHHGLSEAAEQLLKRLLETR